MRKACVARSSTEHNILPHKIVSPNVQLLNANRAFLFRSEFCFLKNFMQSGNNCIQAVCDWNASQDRIYGWIERKKNMFEDSLC